MSRMLVVSAMVLAIGMGPGCGRREESPAPRPVIATPAQPAASAAAASSASPGTVDQLAVTTVSGNAPPKVIAVPFLNPYVHREVDIEVAPEAVDPDYDPVTFRYHWFVNGEKQTDVEGPLLSGDRFRKGDRIALRVVPFDGKVEGEVFAGQSFTVPNAPPRFASAPSQRFKTQTYVYEARAEDPDGDRLAYSLEMAPKGMTIDAESGRVTWECGQGEAGGHAVRIVAADEEGMKAVQEYTLTITHE